MNVRNKLLQPGCWGQMLTLTQIKQDNTELPEANNESVHDSNDLVGKVGLCTFFFFFATSGEKLHLRERLHLLA